MLNALHIENIAVIKNADIEPESGFTVFTGETGAGKSLLLDSIGLLLGSRTSRDLIRTGEDRAFVSAIFGDLDPSAVDVLADNDIFPGDDGQITVSRSIFSDGRSQTKINGRTITVTAQKEIAQALISIHGQHESQSLLDPASHLEYLDSYADDQKLLDEYSVVYKQLTEIRRELKSVTVSEREKARRSEQLRFQISEIDGAKLKDGEEEQLEEKKLKVKNIEKISKQTRLVTRALYRSEKGMPAYELVKRSITALESVADCIPEAGEQITRLKNISYELEDIGSSMENISETDYDDPTAELDRIESRLDVISGLEKKYGTDIREIIAFRDDCVRELEEMETSEFRAQDLAEDLKKTGDEARQIASRLSEVRRNAAEELGQKLLAELAFLEMPKVRMEVEVRRLRDESGNTILGEKGGDEVEILFSANPGEPLRPMSKIASGGELSRIMLAMKTVCRAKNGAGTLIFDEIDTGVSGKTAQKIGLRLREISKNTQVICVTHSAQVASSAHHQYLIQKNEHDGRAETSLRLLSDEERVQEIARIMGGMVITDKLLETAKEMLSNCPAE